MFPSKAFAKACFVLSLCASAALSGQALAETVTERAEKLASQPVQGGAAELPPTTRRAKLTEEQAVTQLKFMTVKAWQRIEKELKDRGSFKAFGLTLSPQGEFRPIFIKDQGDVPQQYQIDILVKNLRAIAETRSVWAVGLMYVTGERRADGSFSKRIAVVGEHIAGWAKAWSYPYRVEEDGTLRLGTSKMVDMKPVYYPR